MYDDEDDSNGRQISSFCCCCCLLLLVFVVGGGFFCCYCCCWFLLLLCFFLRNKHIVQQTTCRQDLYSQQSWILCFRWEQLEEWLPWWGWEWERRSIQLLWLGRGGAGPFQCSVPTQRGIWWSVGRKFHRVFCSQASYPAFCSFQSGPFFHCVIFILWPPFTDEYGLEDEPYHEDSYW